MAPSLSKKANKYWVWLAYDRDGQRVCGVHLGQRDAKTAQGLWEQLEMFDLEHICTDYYPAHRQIVPKHMHVETKAETAAIERRN